MQLALAQRGDDAERRERRRRVVGDRDARPQRRTVGEAGLRHRRPTRPARCCPSRGARLVGLAVAGDRAVTRRGFARAQLARSRGRTRCIVPGREFSTNTSAPLDAARRTRLLAVGARDVERHAALAAAALEERHRRARRRRSRSSRRPSGSRERRQAPARRRHGRLDRDHLGTHRREKERAQRSRDEPAHVDDAHAGAARVIRFDALLTPVLPRAAAGAARTSGSCRSACAGTRRSSRTSSGHFWRARPARFEVRPHRVEVGRGRARLHAHERARALAEARIGRARRPRPPRHPACARSCSSTSTALTFSPPRMMMSFLRSVIARITVGVEHADVAGHEPTVGAKACVGERGIGVADEAVGPAAPDLARLPRLDVACRRRRRCAARRRATARRRCTAASRAACRRCMPVIDGCSVEPKLRVVVMPSRFGALAHRGRHRRTAEADRRHERACRSGRSRDGRAG